MHKDNNDIIIIPQFDHYEKNNTRFLNTEQEM